MIRVKCKACGKSLKIADRLAGKTGKCPSCGEPIKIPQRKIPDANAVVRTAVMAPPVIYDESPSIPTLVTPPRVAVSIRTPSGASHSLGIASVVLGILAFLICWIPFLGLLGLPLSLLGILLGGLGLLMAVFRKGAGIGYPIAGTAISVLAVVTAVSISGAAASAVSQVGESIVEESARADATQQSVVPNSPPIASDGSDAESNRGDSTGDVTNRDAVTSEWADARDTVQQGDLQVRITMVKIGKVPLKDTFRDGSESANELLAITLELKNVNAAKKLDYSTWRGNRISFDRDYATLEDNFENNYKRISFGFGTSPDGAISVVESIYPDKVVTDLLVFERPLDTVEFLRLELPAKNFGGSGMLRFQIPKAMIVR
jgi:hypothetical protein